MDYQKIQKSRIQLLNDANAAKGQYVLYWMQQSQRADHNHALEYAIQQANRLGQGVLVAFGLMDDYPEANRRHYTFMLEGLKETRDTLARLGIKLVIQKGAPDEIAQKLGRKASLIVCDCGYLRHQKAWRNHVAQQAACRVVQVESDVIVPLRVVSNKAEYAARTIRPKIHKHLSDYLIDFKPTTMKKSSLTLNVKGVDLENIDAVLKKLKIDHSVPAVTNFFKGGSSQARQTFKMFLHRRLTHYVNNRNQPQTDDISHMSPYLHFGQISPLYLALQIDGVGSDLQAAKESFLEELIVRRELAINFVNYAPHYDSYKCLPNWARLTLAEHKKDPREYVYTRRQLESAQTHDEYWNAAMRAFADRLRELGHRVIYLKLDDSINRQTTAGNIEFLLRQKKITRFEYLLPDEHRLDLELRKFVENLTVNWQAEDTRHFLTGRQTLSDFFTGKKRYLMESFYRWMRKRHDVLMDNGKPTGGQWNYDQKNRQAYDNRVPIPEPLFFDNDVSEIVRTIRKKKVTTIGEIQADRLLWPTSRAQSLALLKRFVDDFLPAFGTYQDAMTDGNWYLFHSRLSFGLNTKMLHPLEVIEAAVKAWQKNASRINIQQIEGFVRQVLGWREYMRGIYWALMPELAVMNYFDHQAALPEFYWTGDTRMNCLRSAIGQSLKHAYAHHIQRLMVTGNFALLAGVDPAAVDEWYLGIYIDAIQWVELPNTRAMSQFADGGKVATKPYISSAKYIHSMSDYCDSCDYKWKQRHGDMACPFNSLYWNFFEQHRPLLQKNPRVGMMYRVWDRMESREQKQVLKQADAYLKILNRL